MKHTLEKFHFISSKLLLPLLCIFIAVLVLKQINLYDVLINLYQTLIPVFSGFIIAFLLQPIIDKLAKKFPKKVAVSIVYFGILLAGAILMIVLLPVIYQQFVDFSKTIPTWLTKVEDLLVKLHVPTPNFDALKKSFVQEGYSIVFDSLISTGNTITKYGIGYITAFFISIDLEFWIHTLKKVIPNMNQFTTFYKTMSNIIYQYLIGTFLDLAFIAITTGIILYFAGFPNALLYAIILALSNLFPYIGPTIGLVIIIFVGILSYEQPPYMAFFIVWCIQQLESNIVQPIIFNKTMDVRPILKFISLFIFEVLFGIPGVILSPIFAAIIQITFRSYLHSKTSDKVGEWEDIWYDFDEVMKKAKFDTGG